MEELITKKSAISALLTERQRLKRKMDEYLLAGMPLMRENVKAECNRLEEDIAIIKHLPSAQPEQRWIPCSERMPERPERVQIQMKNSWIITGYYDGEAWYPVPDDEVPMDDEYVKAWMPLPEPWKEGAGE